MDAAGIDASRKPITHKRAIDWTAPISSLLALFLALERKIPAELYMYHEVCFSGDAVPSEDELRKLIASHGLAITHLTQHMRDRGKQFELLKSVIEDAMRHAKRLRRDALAEGWQGLLVLVQEIQATFGEDGKPNIAALQNLPAAFEAIKAASPREEPSGDKGSEQEVA